MKILCGELCQKKETEELFIKFSITVMIYLSTNPAAAERDGQAELTRSHWSPIDVSVPVQLID